MFYLCLLYRYLLLLFPLDLQRNYIHLSTFSDPVLLLFTGPGGKRTFIVFTQRTMDMDIPPRITRRFFTTSGNHITYSYYTTDSIFEILSKKSPQFTQSKWVQHLYKSLQDSVLFLHPPPNILLAWSAPESRPSLMFLKHNMTCILEYSVMLE